MTVVERSSQASMISRAMARAMIDYVEGRGYTSRDGAVAIQGRTSDDEQKFDHSGRKVRMVGCRSALAVRQALLECKADEWLVIVTDRDREDLGEGILAHFVGQTLRRPDPWQAVRQRFNAHAVDARLTDQPGHREIAFGLLEAFPPGPWPPAPAGLLTRSHALGTVARARLELPEGATDLTTVLGWAIRPHATSQLAELRAAGGDPLVDAVIGWLGSAAGDAEPLVVALLRSGRPGDLVPLGLTVAQLTAVTDQRQAVELAMARLSHRWAGVSDTAVRALAPQADSVVRSLLSDSRRRPDAERVIAQADSLVKEAQADDLAAYSDVLAAGLNRRFGSLADLLARKPRAMAKIDSAWNSLRQHVLAPTDSRTRAFEGAVRLTRWLVNDAEKATPPHLAGYAWRQLTSGGWVDAAVNDAAAGVGDDHLGQALGSVLGAVTAIRDDHDQRFAREVAQSAAEPFDVLEYDGTRLYPLERLLPDTVITLAKSTPVLLLVLDGLSTGVTVDLMDDLINRTGARWAERLLPGSEQRAGGIAVLPSITDVSRTSLLGGKLLRGQQAVETKAYRELTAAHGLREAPIFHKKELDTVRPGFSLADQVRSAIDDTEGAPLVSCILNTIDDALDRSDPAGTHWDVASVKHLRALMERAREAGRTVVITSDHGHVVERRQGYTRTADGALGAARYRPGAGDLHDDEILVRGQRVLTPDNEAVLAVNERLRYGPLKAGYHGGAAPSEVVVPVIALVPVELAQDPNIQLAPPQEPTWWIESPVVDVPVEEDDATPTLFDDPRAEATQTPGLGDVVVKSEIFRQQRKVAGRVTLHDTEVAKLVNRLDAAPQTRITQMEVAKMLGLAQARINGAFEQLRKLLNVEGYPVVRRDLSTGAIILDASLAREQFGVQP